MTTFWTVRGAAADPHRLAEFWSEPLATSTSSATSFADGAALIDPGDVLPPISFLKVPGGKTTDTTPHLDARVPGGCPGDEVLREQRIRDKAAELVAAGATVVDEYASEASWTTS